MLKLQINLRGIMKEKNVTQLQLSEMTGYISIIED
jgi:hypothetical protein